MVEAESGGGGLLGDLRDREQPAIGVRLRVGLGLPKALQEGFHCAMVEGAAAGVPARPDALDGGYRQWPRVWNLQVIAAAHVLERVPQAAAKALVHCVVCPGKKWSYHTVGTVRKFEVGICTIMKGYCDRLRYEFISSLLDSCSKWYISSPNFQSNGTNQFKKVHICPILTGWVSLAVASLPFPAKSSPAASNSLMAVCSRFQSILKPSAFSSGDPRLQSCSFSNFHVIHPYCGKF